MGRIATMARSPLVAASLAVAVAVFLSAAVPLANEPTPGAPAGCTILDDDDEHEPWRLGITPADPPAKTEKRYPRGWRPWRRRGLGREVITLFSVHSREGVPVIDGRLPPEDVLLDLFRCRGFGTRHPVDPRLVEALIGAARHFESPRVNIISAFRSPKFNDSLGKKGRRVAPESRHTRGEAVDFSVVGADAGDVGTWLWENFEGGVGTYRGDGFNHIDVGPKRRWRGR